eukprot:Em0016g440a
MPVQGEYRTTPTPETLSDTLLCKLQLLLIYKHRPKWQEQGERLTSLEEATLPQLQLLLLQLVTVPVAVSSRTLEKGVFLRVTSTYSDLPLASRSKVMKAVVDEIKNGTSWTVTILRVFNKVNMTSVQSQIQQDWNNREFVETIASSIKKIAEFLNAFDMSARSRLAKLNQKLVYLERQVAFLEARVTKS